MTDLDILRAAPRVTIVEQARPVGSMPLWALHHYEHGRSAGGSLARGDELAAWLAELTAAGHVIALGWDLRDEPAPEAWPGWPAAVPDPEPCGESGCLCYCTGGHACGCDCDDDVEQDGGAS